ncbi:hypothetical protein RB598_007438 [Gaeumannomyces tritici]
MTDKKIVGAEKPVTSALAPGEVAVLDHGYSRDDEVLAALGYKPEFKREFTLWTTFCVSFAVLGLLPSFASTLYYGMGYAGTPGMVWGWLVALVFIACIAASMAELCSAMPTSGGLYYASAVLAGPRWGPFAAWVTGWSNWLGQVSGAPSVNYGVAAMACAAASVADPSYVPEHWHVFLVTLLLMVVHSAMSSMPTRWLATFNSAGSTFNMAALVVVVVLLLAAPGGSAREAAGLPRFNASRDVWGSFYPGTGFPDGVAVLMSFIAVIWTMSGYDSPFHLSEESSNANVAAPRAIVLTATVGGVVGWVLQVAVAYTVVDIGAALASDLGQPWASYLVQVLSRDAALACLALTIIAGFCMGQGCMIAASRVTFAYARDGCFPFARVWARVNQTTKTPVNAVWMNCTVGCLMLLLMFAGDLAIGAIFSIGALAAFFSFTVPIAIRTYVVGARFRPGPWHLGRYSWVFGTLSTGFTALMMPVLCLPTATGDDLSAGTMNWTVVVWGVPMLLAVAWFVVDAHRWFKGPRINVEHMLAGPEREAHIIRGTEAAASVKESV